MMLSSSEPSLEKAQKATSLRRVHEGVPSPSVARSTSSHTATGLAVLNAPTFTISSRLSPSKIFISEARIGVGVGVGTDTISDSTKVFALSIDSINSAIYSRIESTKSCHTDDIPIEIGLSCILI